ncbi:unnamed protein product [Blepharisma stoltei]|uniref:Multifunctional methyltransferase subunit TRM112-like protein n=1 Tax=Blepharisma stoltei TaxID=1481888 RepID=A0AAU9JYS2_9CILI|nr:unnamed protein product [Blepharisma stoltei]
MRLVTLNLLMCNSEECSGRNQALTLNPGEITPGTTQFNHDLTIRMLGKLDWLAFVNAALRLGHELPDNITEADHQNSELIQRIFDILFNVEIQTGELLCPNCNRTYPIEKGIPNMLPQDH